MQSPKDGVVGTKEDGVMTAGVPPEAAERIRRAIPSNVYVLPGSLPVVSFGDPNEATVATLSLNPSWIEFQSPSGEWLVGDSRRLASLVSLGAHDPRDLDDNQVAQVVAESNAYFRGPNWYRSWFGWLESLLTAAGAGSYLDGSACHLDLVQWATKPAQGELPAAAWDRLVEKDREFLQWQLRNCNVSVVLLNGASVVRWIEQAGLLPGFDDDALSYTAKNGVNRIRVFRAVADGVLFLGWNKPLAGAIASEGRQRLSGWLTQALRDHASAPLIEQQALPVQEGVTGVAVELVDGFLPIGTIVAGVSDLEHMLARWLAGSHAPTVGDVGAFGGSPVIVVRMAADEFVLNRDTKRAAVQAFLAEAARVGGAGNLRWRVTANNRGTINRVTYRADEQPTPGWYVYLRKPASEARELR